MSVGAVEAFLKEAIGLDAASIGPSAVLRAVQERCEALGVADIESYWAAFGSCEREQQALIEAVIVPETWFFRDREALAALADVGSAISSRTSTATPLRILSLPCSRGEEPYSIVMALFDAGFSADRFVIDAIDVSQLAIVHAERAVYGRNSFRGGDLSFRDRHFESTASGFLVSERVRTSVRFRQSNLFDPRTFAGSSLYDAIFCRNLLIYFDAPARRRALDLLHQLLTPEGVLFVGPAEAALLADYPFRPARIPLAFAFHRATSTPATRTPRRRQIAPTRVQSVSPPAATPVRPPVSRESASKVSPGRPRADQSANSASLERENWLKRGRQLADEGRLEEAMKCCERHLTEFSESIEGLYLCGLLCDALGRRDPAREYYRRVLYLDPSHYEAIVHLSEILRAAGDLRGADQLRKRALRAQRRGQSA